MKIIKVLLGVIQIIIGFVYFDENRWHISILLIAGGLVTILADTENKFLISFKKVISYIAVLFAVILIFRWFTGLF